MHGEIRREKSTNDCPNDRQPLHKRNHQKQGRIPLRLGNRLLLQTDLRPNQKPVLVHQKLLQPKRAKSERRNPSKTRGTQKGRFHFTNETTNQILIILVKYRDILRRSFVILEPKSHPRCVCPWCCRTSSQQDHRRNYKYPKREIYR